MRYGPGSTAVDLISRKGSKIGDIGSSRSENNNVHGEGAITTDKPFADWPVVISHPVHHPGKSAFCLSRREAGRISRIATTKKADFAFDKNGLLGFLS